MFQKIKSALLICLILLIVSIPNTGYTQEDIYGNLGPRKTSTTATTPILDAIKNLPSQQKAQQNIDKQKDVVNKDVVNRLAGNSYLGTTSPAKTAVDVQQKLLQKSQEETAANITQQITQKSNEDYSTDLKTNMDTALSDLEKTKTSIKDTEAELKTLKEKQEKVKEIQEKFNDETSRKKEIEKLEKELKSAQYLLQKAPNNPNAAYFKSRVQQISATLTVLRNPDQIQAEIEKKQEELEKLQEKELEQSYIAAGLQASYQNAQQSLAAFNNAQNIGNLELMKAANGRVTYQGCTFLGNFDPNSALGSGNNRILQSAICWMQDVSASLGVGMALGATLIKANTDGFWDGVMTIAIGVCMFLAFFLIYLMFPLKLLDAFIRLAFVFALMPLWIILWVFPATAGYTKKAWDTFIGTLFYFISLSIVIALVLILMNESIQPEGTRTEIFKLMLGDNTPKAAKLLSFGKTFFLTLAFGLMSYTLLNTAEALSNMFASAPSLGLDKAMTGNATQAYQFTKSAAGTAKRAVTGGAALVGAGIGYARGKFGQKNSGGNAEPADNSTKPTSLGKFEGASGSGENAGSQTTGGVGEKGGSQQNNPTFTYTPSSTNGTNGTWSFGSTPSTSTNANSQPTSGSGEKGGSQPTGGAGENAFGNSSSVDERRKNGVNTAELIHRNATASQMDKTSKNAYIQKMLDQFYDEEFKKGIIYSKEEKDILSRRANGKLSSKDAKKEFNKINRNN